MEASVGMLQARCQCGLWSCMNPAHLPEMSFEIKEGTLSDMLTSTSTITITPSCGCTTDRPCPAHVQPIEPNTGDPFENPPWQPNSDPVLFKTSPTTGWACPKCGRCYAPHVDECRHCGPVAFSTTEITYVPE